MGIIGALAGGMGTALPGGGKGGGAMGAAATAAGAPGSDPNAMVPGNSASQDTLQTVLERLMQKFNPTGNGVVKALMNKMIEQKFGPQGIQTGQPPKPPSMGQPPKPEFAGGPPPKPASSGFAGPFDNPASTDNTPKY